MNVVWYEHHGNNVAVFDELKGKHREHCLCFSCKKLKVKKEDNCPIAQATFDNCVRFGTVTPMWECGQFDEVEEIGN